MAERLTITEHRASSRGETLPAGFAAVPIKPTVEMFAAALRAGAGTASEAFAIWQAMLAASDRQPPA